MSHGLVKALADQIPPPEQQAIVFEQLPDQVIFAIAARLYTTKDVLAFRGACKRHWQLLDLAGMKYLSRLAFSKSSDNIARVEHSQSLQKAVDTFSRIRDHYIGADELVGSWVDDPKYFNLIEIEDPRPRPYLSGSVWWFHIHGTFKGVNAGIYTIHIEAAWPDDAAYGKSVSCIVNGVKLGEVHSEHDGVGCLHQKHVFWTTKWELRSYTSVISVSEDNMDVKVELKNIDTNKSKCLAVGNLHLEKLRAQ